MRKILLIPILLSLIFSGCASVITQKKTEPTNPNKLYSPEELKEDLDYLFQTMEDVHPNLYAYTPKSVIDSLREKATGQLTNPKTAFEFGKLITPLVVKLGDGHTFLHFPGELWQTYLNDSGKLVPFKIIVEEDQLLVKKNYTNDSTLSVNTKIISINNVPAKDIIQAMLKYTKGEKLAFRKKRISKHFASLLWALYDIKSDFSVEYLSALDDQKYINTFSGITLNELDGSLKNETNKQTKLPFSYRLLPNDKIGIIDLKSFADSWEIFEQYCENTFGQIQKDSVQTLIIDIRENGGGDSYNGDILFNYITDKPYLQIEQADYKISKNLKQKFRQRAKRRLVYAYYILYPLLYIHPDGRKIFASKNGTMISYKIEPYAPDNNHFLFKGDVYLLTGQYTFSAAVDFASAFNCYNMGTIIGEETGGLTVSFIDIIHFTLPNTNLRFGVADKRNINACGKEDGHGVIPDFEVKQTPEDREKGIDTVLEFTKELIKKNKTTGVFD